MDLRSPTPIGAHIEDPFQQLEWGRGYDHNYVVDGPFGLLRPAAWARSAASGIALQVDTTLPGLQFYTANFLEAGDVYKRQDEGPAPPHSRYGAGLCSHFGYDAPR